MESPSTASQSSALYWLAEGVWRRFVLKFYFEIWYLADATHYALLQAQDSALSSALEFSALGQKHRFNALSKACAKPAAWQKH